MRVVIAGGHSAVGRHLAARLTSQGHTVFALVPTGHHHAAVRPTGAHPVTLDPGGRALAETLPHADAVVYTAGTTRGPGNRPGELTYAAALDSIGVRRYLVLTTNPAAHSDSDTPERTSYLAARATTEEAITAHDLDWTFVHAAPLADTPPTGLVSLSPSPARIPRADVAAVLAALIPAAWSHRASVDLGPGETPIAEAVSRGRR
ncbi:NAD(P)H-binding protein [Actinokineospora pegani]|uniref:NAD(P)H-binding protein n=1 Tax=Actinokineospora pegani TaxID=2654637 RepID=UPI0012EAF17A|nr:NAD(P)H-binding protein [Actinokineospora pegani]